MTNALEDIANQMVKPGGGILAADESAGTIERNFNAVGLESTFDTRRDYRTMLFTTPGLNQYINGVILFTETLAQSTREGEPLVEILSGNGMLPGVKVDLGTVDMEGYEGEKVTLGLDGMRERLDTYKEQGAVFAKDRVIYVIGDGKPSEANVQANANHLAQYAKNCHESGLVPIVEPEVLRAGDHSIDACYSATRRVLNAVFEQLSLLDVDLKGVVLKPNMVTVGADNIGGEVLGDVPRYTVGVLEQQVPENVAGIAFLSGGLSDEAVTGYLNDMNATYDTPWPLSFSFGRALQRSALQAFSEGGPSAIIEGQRRLFNRAKESAMATLGTYNN
tara:strand:- start:14250 stop:15251 length:1002 start_codon:yes stop_codon:yes gene_type:complete